MGDGANYRTIVPVFSHRESWHDSLTSPIHVGQTIKRDSEARVSRRFFPRTDALEKENEESVVPPVRGSAVLTGLFLFVSATDDCNVMCPDTSLTKLSKTAFCIKAWALRPINFRPSTARLKVVP